jgi:hypothetical protein
MGTKEDEAPVINRVVVAILFTSFILAFIIITAQFIYTNVKI